MTERITLAIAAAIADLDWFAVPHTIDQLLGIYAESLGEGRPLSRRTLSNEECLRAIAARVGGRASGHADPTADSALAGEPGALDDADGTVGAIDACLEQIHAAAQELADLVADATGSARWVPVVAGPRRQDRLMVISALLARLSPNLAEAAMVGDVDEMDELARYAIAESAAWLRTKGEEIWRASRGDLRPVAVQRAIVPCRCCGGWRAETIATTKGLCDQCAEFQHRHRCLPTQPIVRRWEYGQAATPGQILEAKAASRAKVRAG